MSVDWDAIDDKLPTECTPDGQAKRRKLFADMDPNQNGLLTLTEVEAGLPALIRGSVPNRNFRPAVKCAFNVARGINEDAKGRAAKMVDRHEFHGLLAAFRHFIELDMLFDQIDQDGSRTLSWKECQKCLSKLDEWNIDRTQARRKFPADEWEESLKFDDFAEWCIARRLGKMELKLDENDPFETLQESAFNNDGIGDAGKLLKSFQLWDANGDGKISTDELSTLLKSLDSSFTDAMVATLFEVADVNKDGTIDYAEFAKWITAAE